MRKLASIQRIEALDPIPNADAIEVASILGWKVVVKKGEFKVGDSVVYVEIDSILPERPEFEFMKPRGMRVRTVRLRGQVSQGITFPASILEPDMNQTVDRDVTEQLGIVKYEPALHACLAGEARGLFPAFLQKTDEDRIQTFRSVLNKYGPVRCRVTEKLDGSSATFYLRDGEFGVCSRNLELKEDDTNSFWRVARAMDIETKLRVLGRNIALQGELIGEGIQKNKYALKGHTVRFFDVFDIDQYRPMDIVEAEVLLHEMDLPAVPVLLDITLSNHTVDSLVTLATRKTEMALNDRWAEGIVVRSYTEMTETFITGTSVNRGRISFKVINPEFLLKHGE